MRHLASALALASLYACAGNTHSPTDLLPPDGGGLSLVDAGPTDGGPDGGVDAGPDAGCVPRSLSTVGVIDNCLGPQNAIADVVVAGPAQGCGVTISLNNGLTPCTGVASRGTLDAFDGGCAGLSGYTCTSISLPGTLNCTNGLVNCSIRICDAGLCQ
jgi:hypothetical protein